MSEENAQQLRLALEHESNTVRRQRLLKEIWSLAREHQDHEHQDDDAKSRPGTVRQVRDAKAVKKIGMRPLHKAST